MNTHTVVNQNLYSLMLLPQFKPVNTPSPSIASTPEKSYKCGSNSPSLSNHAKIVNWRKTERESRRGIPTTDIHPTGSPDPKGGFDASNSTKSSSASFEIGGTVDHGDDVFSFPSLKPSVQGLSSIEMSPENWFGNPKRSTPGESELGIESKHDYMHSLSGPCAHRVFPPSNYSSPVFQPPSVSENSRLTQKSSCRRSTETPARMPLTNPRASALKMSPPGNSTSNRKLVSVDLFQKKLGVYLEEEYEGEKQERPGVLYSSASVCERQKWKVQHTAVVSENQVFGENMSKETETFAKKKTFDIRGFVEKEQWEDSSLRRSSRRRSRNSESSKEGKMQSRQSSTGSSTKRDNWCISVWKMITDNRRPRFSETCRSVNIFNFEDMDRMGRKRNAVRSRNKSRTV